MQGGLCYDIDPSPKQILQVHQEPADVEQCSTRLQIDQNVHIAVQIRIVARHRTEDPDAGCPVQLGEPQDRVALCLDQSIHRLFRASANDDEPESTLAAHGEKADRGRSVR